MISLHWFIENYLYVPLIGNSCNSNGRLCFYRCLSVNTGEGGVYPISTHNTSTGPVSFPGGYPSDWSQVRMGVPSGREGYPPPGIGYAWDRLCCRWYTSCSFPQEDFLVNHSKFGGGGGGRRRAGPPSWLILPARSFQGTGLGPFPELNLPLVLLTW